MDKKSAVDFPMDSDIEVERCDGLIRFVAIAKCFIIMKRFDIRK